MYSNENLTILRQAMKEKGLKAYLIQTGDPHNSEEPAAYYAAERRFFCPFTGDNAYVIVTEDKAYIFSDGRFNISAPLEIKGTPYEFIELYKPGFPTPYDLIKESGLYPLGTDFSILSPLDLSELEEGGKVLDVSFAHLVKDREPLSASKIWRFDDPKYQDKTSVEKIAEIRKQFQSLGTKAHLVTTLDDIAYLTNLRGEDVDCTPVFYSYLYIDSESAHLFVDPSRIDYEVEGLIIHPYAEVFPFVKERSDVPTLVDPNECNAKLYRELAKPITGEAPSRLMKAVKGPKEIENIISIQAEDGVALLKFSKYLEENDLLGKSEWDLAGILHGYRAEGKRFIGESFTTIAAINSNAAMMHYAPTAKTYSIIDKDALELLVDSGGQYLGGTTDTTRTFLIGKPTKEYIHDYTLTLKSVIALSSATFIQGTTGRSIDMLARHVMWKEGLDYKCGTGHGVGYVSVVHESPNGFRYRAAKGKNDGCANVPGMITTIEPGVYKANKYGIRIENNLLTVPAFETPDGVFYKFKNVTFVPIDTKALDLSIMTEEEIDYLNAYHQEVDEHLSPLVDGELLDYLKEKTKPISK